MVPIGHVSSLVLGTLLWCASVMNFKDIMRTKPYKWARYLGINSLFAVCIYFGFFAPELIEGAANVAVFMAWGTGILGAFILIVITLDSRPDAKGDLLEIFTRMDPSVVPFWFDVIFDFCVVIAFIWSGYYWVSVFYLVSIHAGRILRELPQDIMLKKLKSQQ